MALYRFGAALVGGVALGLANPSLGCLAHRYHVAKFSTFGIFIISGKKIVWFVSFFNFFYGLITRKKVIVLVTPTSQVLYF